MKNGQRAAAGPAGRRETDGGVLRFGAFRFDPVSLELWRSDRPVPLPPLPARLLARLLDREGELVTRDELTGALWGRGVYVDADAGLNTAVRQVRRALGDRATSPRFVETVPRRGYRFVAPLAGPARPEPRRRRVGWLAAAAMGGLLAWTGARVASNPSTDVIASTRTAADRPPVVQIVVAPAATPDLDLVALSVTDLVRLDLARTPGLGVVTAEDGTLGRIDHRLTVRAEPAEWAGHARLEASLSEAGEPEPTSGAGLVSTLPLLDTTVSLDAFPVVRRDIATQLARRLAISLGTAAPGLGTTDAQAWRLFLEARAGMEEMACDGNGPASLLERSLDNDPNFVAAWYMLAVAHFLHGNLCSGGPEDYDAAAAAARRTAELAPGWADPVQLEAGILLHRGRTEEAMQLTVEALRRFPDEPFVLLRASEVLRYAGLLPASARLFERVLGEHPAHVLQSDTVAYPYLYREEWERFLELLPARTGPFFRYYRGWAEARLGNLAAARAALAPAFQEHAGDAFARLSEALLAVLDGRTEEARVTLEQLARQREARRVGDGEMTFKIGLLMVLADAPERGLELLELAVAQGFFCPPCLEGGGLPERLAGTEVYGALLEGARSRREAFARRFLAADGTLGEGATPAS